MKRVFYTSLFNLFQDDHYIRDVGVINMEKRTDTNKEDAYKKRHAVVKSSNELAVVPLQNFTAFEIDSFMALCFFLQNQGSSRVKIGFNEFRKLIGYTRRGDSALVDKLSDMAYKFSKISLTEKNEDMIKIIVPFIDFEINKKESCFIVGAHPEFAYALNDLTGGPGKRYSLTDVISIGMMKSTYSKQCLKVISSFRNRGCWEISVEGLRYYLDIPANYRTSDINKILETITREFEEAQIFEYFEIIPRTEDSRQKSTGRKKILGYVFSFKFNDNYLGDRGIKREKAVEQVKCPMCGKSMMKIARKDGTGYFYGHRNGFNPDAECRYTMSVEQAEESKNRKKDPAVRADERADIEVSAGELERYYRHIRETELIEAAKRKDEIKENEPEIWELYKDYENLRADTMRMLGTFSFSEEGKLKKKKANEKVSEASAKFCKALVNAGYDEDYMNPKYRCRLCKDTGQMDNGRFCTCRSDRIKEAAEWLGMQGGAAE